MAIQRKFGSLTLQAPRAVMSCWWRLEMRSSKMRMEATASSNTKKRMTLRGIANSTAKGEILR